MGLNKFAALTKAEFKARYLGYKKTTEEKYIETVYLDESKTASAIDWRSKGAVTPIKD